MQTLENISMPALELAMQELDIHELEELDAPVGWSEVLSAVGGFVSGAVISYSIIITLAT
jgi:hypothetical protein